MEESEVAPARMPAGGSVERSVAHALVVGLRRPGDEVQLTNVIAAIGAADARFATGFARAVLDQVADDCAYTAAAQERLKPIPDALEVDRERRLSDEDGNRLGRIDLIFEEPGEQSQFTLLVENKLYAGYGPEQLARYHRALREVRKRGGRGGLVAVTRDVPARGELEPTEEEWLGSIRWARLLPRLRGLSPQDAGVAGQWQRLLEVLDEQGDLGMTTIDADAVRGWAKYSDGRVALRWLLEQVHGETLATLRTELRRYRTGRSENELAGQLKASSIVQATVYEVKFGLSVPAEYNKAVVIVECWMEDRQPLVGVTVAPRDADAALDEGSSKFRSQINELLDGGFTANEDGASWYSQHELEPVLASPDAPAALLALIKPDVRAIVASGILRYDLTEPLPRAVRRKKAKP
ncbi:PD-(D/E)XK nuclease superfamily protein [Solirubrobacter pauli]|uniref:PD-(D/E)XK nuclease superfamily protein n=1 Tax=Solirubrobacter pauli TaxID=166793 RepID=A0A660LAJ3_9ACTN|nr:PD-(D/E)XK nuclease family protein [Solirubrobacter pauli]RKQ90930.1 PD-(D/E)XK nuclease superfamily protein [Solirubrobacter pauli]